MEGALGELIKNTIHRQHSVARPFGSRPTMEPQLQPTVSLHATQTGPKTNLESILWRAPAGICISTKVAELRRTKQEGKALCLVLIESRRPRGHGRASIQVGDKGFCTKAAKGVHAALQGQIVRLDGWCRVSRVFCVLGRVLRSLQGRWVQSIRHHGRRHQSKVGKVVHVRSTGEHGICAKNASYNPKQRHALWEHAGRRLSDNMGRERTKTASRQRLTKR